MEAPGPGRLTVDLGALLAPRSVEDILAERVVLTLGGDRYVLPVLPILASQAWEEQLEDELVWLLRTVRKDTDDVEAVLRALATSPGRFIDVLLAYDRDHLLPDRKMIEATTTEIGVLCAVLEVWRAAHPFADIGLGLWLMTGQLERASQVATSSPWRPGPATPIDGSERN